MQIVVHILATPILQQFGGAGPGQRTVFSHDLVLERVDNKTPGNGMPTRQKDRLAGTHSGIVTTLRIAGRRDNFYPAGSQLYQYVGTYFFNYVPKLGVQALLGGQVSAQGVYLLDANGQQIWPYNAFTITGGTATYAYARGVITEQPNNMRQLDILIV